MSEVKTLATLVLGGAFDATELGDNEIYPDMSLIESLQQQLVTGFDDVSIELVSRIAYDAAQSELAALREDNRLLNHDIASYLETTAKVCELLSIDIDNAKYAEGKPSDVLFSHTMELQQRLTAAEQRNATLIELLRKARRSIDPSCSGKSLREELDAALRTKSTESGASE